MSEDNNNLQIISTSTINVPSTPPINLTPSDLQLLFLEYAQVGLLFLEPSIPPVRTSSSASLIHHLRASFQRALNAFPPLTGRLASTTSHDGAATGFFIDCNNDQGGAVFIHAVANTLTSADIYGATTDLFFPLTGAPSYDDGVPRPLLAVQVTELVDGLFVGMSNNQVILDATSLWLFLASWARISRGEGPVPPPPFLDRDNLNLDLAASRIIYIDNQHLLQHTNPLIQSQTLTDRAFHLTRRSIAELKARANRELQEINGAKISSLQAVIAHLWRSIIRCRFELNLCNQEITTFEIPMCVRRKLDPPLPREYFGNATIPVIVNLEARQIVENGVGWTAWQINRTVATFSDSEKIKCFYRDWIQRPKFPESASLPSNYFVLINSPRLNFNATDFGWGKPAAIRSGVSDFFDGRIAVFGGCEEEGSIDIEVCSSAETLSCLAEDTDFIEFFTPKCSFPSVDGLSKL